MVAFSGVGHVSMSVTDLDRSERFYTEVFDLIRMADFGVARVLLHRQTGFMFAIASHEAARGGPFSELNTGLDHLGFVAERPGRARRVGAEAGRRWASSTPRSATWSSGRT